MKIITNFIDGIVNIISSLDPSELDFGSGGDVIVYIIKLLIVIGAFVLIFFGIYKSPEIYKFLKNTYRELKVVDWLSKKLTYKYTLYTLIFVIFSTLFILLADQAFLKLRNLLI